MRLTVKQINILNTLNVDKDTAPLDMSQLIEQLPYETTKQSMQFSIRALIGKGLVLKIGQESRRGKSRVVLGLTDFGKEVMSNSETKSE